MKMESLKQLIRPRLSKKPNLLAKSLRKDLLTKVSSAAGFEFPSCRSSLADIHVNIQLYGTSERTAKHRNA